MYKLYFRYNLYVYCVHKTTAFHCFSASQRYESLPPPETAWRGKRQENLASEVCLMFFVCYKNAKVNVNHM
jgi:hypothetical protein